MTLGPSHLGLADGALCGGRGLVHHTSRAGGGAVDRDAEAVGEGRRALHPRERKIGHVERECYT